MSYPAICRAPPPILLALVYNFIRVTLNKYQEWFLICYCLYISLRFRELLVSASVRGGEVGCFKTFFLKKIHVKVSLGDD